MAEELKETASFTSAAPISAPVEYNTRDLILYAIGIGSKDKRYVFEQHDDFAAFPTYPIVLTFKGTSQDVLSFPPPFMMQWPMPSLPGVMNVLDAEKYIEKINDLPKDGAKLNLVGRTCGVHKKGKHGLIEQEFILKDDAGKEYYKLVSGAMMIGAKGFAESGQSYSKDSKPPKDTPPAHTIETTTDETQTHIYRLSGDYNPLHIDEEQAQGFGFEKPILHGQCTMGIVARGLLDTLGGGSSKRFKSIALRFASPVLPGQTLVTEVWPTGPSDFIFTTKVKETGKVCVNNGRFALSPEAKL